MPRYHSIDVLRGLAILLMIQVHFVDNLSSRAAPFGWLYDASMLLGSLSAPLFTFLSGVSYALWMRKQEDQGVRAREVTRRTLRRGWFLFGLGLLFNFAIWLPAETFNWDILTLLGTSFLFLAVARKLPLPVLTLICVAVVVVSPPLRVVGDYGSYWDEFEYSYDFTFRDVLFGFVANGYFPLFPWLAFPVAGFVCGELLFRSGRRTVVVQKRLVLVGLGMMALAGFGAAIESEQPQTARYYLSDVTEFPASTGHVLLTLGGSLMVLVLLHRGLDRTQPQSLKRFVVAMSRFSAFSLSIYVLHHMLLIWPLWLYGAGAGHDDSTVYWRLAMPTEQAFGLSVAFIVLCHFGLRVWERRPRYSLEALMRRVCDGPAKRTQAPRDEAERPVALTPPA